MEKTSIKMQMLEVFRQRMYYFLTIALILFLVLLLQLINLQLIHGRDYKLKSKMNMENSIPIPASRGEIYDRNFKSDSDNVTLVTNRPSFNLTTIPSRFKTEDELNRTFNNLSHLLDISNEEVIDNINSKKRWERVAIKEDIDFNVIVKIASHQNRFPNIEWEAVPVRVYSYKEMFSHVIGYIGYISSGEYRRLRGKGYKHYHKIGKTGVEKEYDEMLRGIDGYIRRIVDVKNRIEGEEVGSSPVTGNNIVLTIDYEIQKVAYEAMKNRRGAIIVIKPTTGEIIALISKPDFDPNLLILGNNNGTIRELSNNTDKPFINRAIQSRYPPASTYKLITAIAALEEEKWKAKHTLFCPGKYTLQGYVDRNFYCHKPHGILDMHEAISESCSVYFYQLGYLIGPSIILKYADYFGLGEETGIDIPGEISGFIPSKKWKLKTFGQPWFDGDTLNLSIGQGFVSVTILGMANFVSGVINNGVIYKPHIMKEIRTFDNQKVIMRSSPKQIREIPLSPLTSNTIKHGMRLAVRKGTARRLKYIKIPIAGKTGTAQTRSRRKDDSTQHAWFVGYAPYGGDKERSIVVAVLVEHGITGAVWAVPIAEKIFLRLVSLGYFDV